MLPPRSNLADLQRGLVLLALLSAAGWWWWSADQGWALPVRLAVLLLLLMPHAPVLALEFVMLARFSSPSPAPAPRWHEVLKAWAGEVVMGLLTFAWRQPWRWRSVPDHLPASAQGRRGVLLIHGFVCNRGLWLPWLERLRALGRPCVAINLEPVFGSIDDYVPLVEAAVARLESATGQPPLIVAHSMGGLATRAWLRQHQADARCAGVVTIGTPHRGTWLARFALTANGRQMRRSGPWLAALSTAEPPQRYQRFTCYFSHCDNIVFPAATATLPGADNRHLAGTAHVDLVMRPEVFEEVLRRLEAPAA